MKLTEDFAVVANTVIKRKVQWLHEATIIFYENDGNYMRVSQTWK